MILLKKKLVWIILGLVIMVAIGFVAVRLLVKPYVILQQERSISIGQVGDKAGRDFVMSPAKIQINKMKLNQEITIPTKIINGEGDTTYLVKFGEPSFYDKGFVKDTYNDYEYSWNRDTIYCKSNSTEVVNITIKKLTDNPHHNLEKGIAITQQAGQGLTMVRSYIFEILIK